MLSLSPQVFMILSQRIEEHSGLHYGLDDLELLAGKVSGRARERGFESLLDYYYFLRYDAGGPAELDALIEALVVHETYFFREIDQLNALIEHMVVPRVAAGRMVRIWSAACATGEEPLTLAIALARRGLLERVELVASDISRAALDVARAGVFSGRSLRALPANDAGAFLHRDGDFARVDRRLVEAVSWRRINLVDQSPWRELGVFDAILCRNMLIYVSDDVARRVVDRLTGALAPDGYLAVGVSESLLRFGSSLACEERGGSFFYRRAPS